MIATHKGDMLRPGMFLASIASYPCLRYDPVMRRPVDRFPAYFSEDDKHIGVIVATIDVREQSTYLCHMFLTSVGVFWDYEWKP